MDIVKCLVGRQSFTIQTFFTIQHVFLLEIEIRSQQVFYYIHIFYYIHVTLYMKNDQFRILVIDYFQLNKKE